MLTQQEENKRVNTIKNLAFAKMPVEDIAKAVDLTIDELNLKYGNIIQKEPANILANIIGAFIDSALKGNTAAQIFCMKAVFNWSDNSYEKIQNPVVQVPNEVVSMDAWRAGLND